MARSGTEQERRQVAGKVRQGQDVGMQIDAERVGHEPRDAPGCVATRPDMPAASSARNVSSASTTPSSMLVVKYAVPVAGMMSHCNAVPERSSMREPGYTGELTHSSRWSWWPGFRRTPKKGSPMCSSTIALQLATDLPDVQCLVPVDDGFEVGRDEPLDVVLRVSVELGRVLHDEAGPAVERAPDAERDRERIATLDRPVSRAEQAELRSLTGGQHQMARQGRAVPREQACALALGHARLSAP